MTIQKIKSGRIPGQDVEFYVGAHGQLFYDEDTGILRISDGVTPGGTVVSGGTGGGTYTLPTATTTVKGGVKIDGTTINIANQVISVGTVPYASISNAPTAVSAFTNDSGYITSSALSSYATQTYVTTRGYITSAGIPSVVSSFTNDSGYVTSSSFDLDTIDFDTNNKLHATGVLPGDAEGFTAIFAGRAAGVAALPNTVIQSQAQVNDYAQNNFQNTNDGNHASTEWVATSPNGSDTDYYIDLGINGASWDGTAENSLYDNVGQRDGWLYVQGGNAGGGNLVLGTSIANTYTKIIAGDASAGNKEVVRFSETEVKLSKQLTFSDNTTQTTAWTGSVSWSDVTSKPTILTTLNSLDDVTTVGATDGQVLKYNASLSIWQPAADLVGSGGSGIGLTDLSASNASASGGGSLSYNNTSGVFTFTPPNLTSYVTNSSLSSTLLTYATQTYVTSQGYITSSGNAATATKLGTARAINGINFDGSAAITITAVNPNALTIGTGLSGTSYDGSTAVTVAVDNTIARRADTTYVGTTSIALNRSSASQTLTGVSIDGNADTVTNGVYTTGTYANPAWITSLAYSKLTGTPTIFSGSYTDLTNKPTIPTNVSQLANDSGYITAAAIPAQFTFNVAADDSSLKTISSQETIKFIGANNITTSSDAEGNITITGPTLTGYATKTGAETLTSKNISGSSNTITNIANSSLSNSSVTIGTTSISLGSSSTTLGGMAWITFAGSTSGTTQLRPSAIAGTTTVTMPGTTGTLITTGDTGTVTNAMLAGSIATSKITGLATSATTDTTNASNITSGTLPNARLSSVPNSALANSSISVNGTSISLGGSGTITVNSISASGFTGVLGFDASGSLILSNTNKFRSPSGLIIETGTSPLKDWTFGTTGSLTFPDNTTQSTAYTGNADTVTNGVYTTDTGTVTNTMLAGSIANSKLANSSVTINGTSIALGASATITAAAGTLTGTTLNSTVVTSSLTSVGTLTSLTTSGTITSSKTGTATHGTGAQLYINGSTYSRIDFNNVYGAPTVTDRSTGTRILFNPDIAVNKMDCAIGMSTDTLWSSVQGPNFNFGWYAGDGLGFAGSNAPVTLLTLSGAGVLTIPGTTSVTNNSATNKTLNIGTHGQLFDDGNLHIHTSSGTLWINSLDSSDISIGTQYNSGSGSSVNIGKNLVANSGSVTANATTAFIAGDNAVSGVALQMPNEGALRNLKNGSTNMYFDVSIGGSTQGSFQFRSSSSYTNVLTMSSTGVTFNTDATFTSRTPSVSRTAYNAAIDTEITLDNMRFRISNQGGIFPQVIGNGSSRNLAWTGVGAINGAAVAQAGSTGTIVSTSAWTTLYNLHGMDAAGDTVTVTLQDKAAGRIYRITFMRSDNGSTTGYNIIGERIL